MKKDVVYVDNDDEIASITDKVQSSKEKIVALVLPKRCTVLQSSINMKILFKVANDTGKQVVLITSEAGLLPLAGMAGLYVAKTLQSKPLIPGAPDAADAAESVVEVDEAEPEIDESKSIGELADDTPIDLGDEPVTEDEAKKEDTKKDKKLAVPNFDSFRTKLFIGIGVILALVAIWVMATIVLPKADVLVKIQYKSVPVSINGIGSPQATTTDTATNTVPSQTKNIDKTETKKFQATGEKNVGTKATGKVALSVPCSAVSDTPPTIPAGTGVSTGSLTYITQESVNVSTLTLSPCKFTGFVNVLAQNPGDQYNISSGRSFTVAGYSSVTGSNSAGMSGGTNKNVKVVSQGDCDVAKSELLATSDDIYKTQLSEELVQAGMTPLTDTFSANPGAVTCSPGVNEEATEATATVQLKFSMSGVSTEGMNQLIAAQVDSQINKDNEIIYENGIKTGKFTITAKKANGTINFTYNGDAKTGVKQDTQVIADAIAGKKFGESMTILRALPGVSDAEINYSPFWVKKTPNNKSHITVNFNTTDANK